MILNNEIINYISQLNLISSLAIDDFSDDGEDNILPVFYNIIDSTVSILGTTLDEKMSILLKESERLLNKIEYDSNVLHKKHTMLLPSYFINNGIRSILVKKLDLLTMDSYEYPYEYICNYITKSVDDEFRKLNSLSICGALAPDISSTIKDVKNFIDDAYFTSKDLCQSIKDNIFYIYFNGENTLDNISYITLDLILYLLKYYILTNAIVVSYTTELNNSLNKVYSQE